MIFYAIVLLNVFIFHEECNKCEASKASVNKLSDEMKEKDAKWNILINSLHEKLVKANKDKLKLENEKHKMRLKNVKSKIGQELRMSKAEQSQQVKIINHQEGEAMKKVER